MPIHIYNQFVSHSLVPSAHILSLLIIEVWIHPTLSSLFV